MNRISRNIVVPGSGLLSLVPSGGSIAQRPPDDNLPNTMRDPQAEVAVYADTDATCPQHSSECRNDRRAMPAAGQRRAGLQRSRGHAASCCRPLPLPAARSPHGRCRRVDARIQRRMAP